MIIIDFASCGECKHWEPSGAAHTKDMPELGDCRLNPEPYACDEKHWCGQFSITSIAKARRKELGHAELKVGE